MILRPTLSDAWHARDVDHRAQAAADAEETGAALERVTLPDLLRAVTGLLWVVWGLLIYMGTFVVPGTTVVVLAYTVLGVVAMGLPFTGMSRRQRRMLDVALLLGTLFAFGFWVHSQVYVTPAYGTDELAFDQGAASLLLHGSNPYGVDLSWTLDHFQVPSTYYTYRLDGSTVTHLSYPAQSFLVYLPVMWAGLQAQAAVYVDAAFWALAAVALWLALPWRARPLVPVLTGLTVYVSFVVGGVSDALYVPFLVGALWHWDRFGERGAGAAGWMGPLLLGTAAGMKQSVWFLVPFLLVALAVEGRRSGQLWLRRPLRYAALLALAFAIPNLPFIIWDWHTWVAGVLLPLHDALIPFGQAVVALPVYAGLGGGHLGWFTLAGMCAAAALCCALVRWYDALKRAIPMMPALILLFPTRSMASYFIFVLPGLLVSAMTVRSLPRWRRPRGSRLAAHFALGGAVVFACGSVALVAAAVASPGPLRIAVVGRHATGQLESVDTLRLRVTNTDARALQPHFVLANGVYMSTPWLVRTGPQWIAPQATADYDIAAPNQASMPGLDAGFRVLAMTSTPATLSESPVSQPSADRTELTPQAVNRIVAAGDVLTLHVRVLDRLGQEVHTAGIPVALGQVVYAQEGLFPGESSINGAPEGQSPVVALTDGSGVATFTVRAVQTQPFELFYQAWLTDDFPHGYSNMVAVRYAYP